MQKLLRLLVTLAFFMVPWVTMGQNARVSEYDGSSSTATYSSIVSTGTPQTLSSGYADITMPFDMYFGENQVPQGSSLRVWNDGSVTFNGIAALADARIAPLWLSSGYTTATVYTRSTEHMLTVEWRKVIANDVNSYSFQLKLYDNGDVEFCYGPMIINGNINVFVGMMSSSTDIYRVGGRNNGYEWDTIYRNISGSDSRPLSTAYYPAYNTANNQGLVYTFSQPACVKPTSITAEATAWNTVKVDWEVSSNGNGYEVKYSTNPSFNPDEDGQSKTVSGGTSRTTNITNLTGSTTYYFYVRKLCSDATSGWTSMAYATTLPGCYNANMPSVTSSGVVTWTSPHELVTSYDVKYGLAGFDPETEGTAINGITGLTTTIPVAGLQQAATYQVYLRTHCSASGLETEWVGPASFNTPCGTIEVPYLQNFVTNNLPVCWEEEVISGTNTWEFSDQNQYATFLYELGNSSRLLTPVFNLNPAGAYQVEFDHAAPEYEGIADELRVYYRTSATSEWILLAEYTTILEYFTHEVILLPNPTSTYQLSFVGTGVDGNSVYLTNVKVRVQPSCIMPTGLAEDSHTGTTATLSWTQTGTVASWQIALDGDETNLITANSNPFTITGLTAEQTYSAKVRAYCNADDQSEWSNVIYFTPSNVSTLTVNDGTSTNEYVPVYGYYVDSYSRSQFIIPSDRLTALQWGTVQKMTFYATDASVDWGSAQFDVYMTEVGSTTLSSLADWNSMEVVYSGSLTINNYVMEITLDAPYQYMGGNLMIGVNETQNGSYVRKYFYGVTANGASMGGYGSSVSQMNFLPKVTFAYIPGEPLSCFKPNNLTVSGVTSTEATLSWNELGLSTQWEVKYGHHGFNPYEEGYSVIVNTNPTVTLSYLELGQSYDAYVRAICNPEGPTEWSSVCEFQTELCLSFAANEDIVIGDGTTTNQYLPTYTYYNYSLTQQIFDAAELGGSSTFTSIAFYKSTSNTQTRNLDIYIGETTKSTFSSGTDWVSVTADGIVKVFSGNVSFVNGWNTINFDTYFDYSGNNNIVVIVDDNTGSYVSSPSFYVTSATSKAIRVYSDGTNYNPVNPTYSGSVLNVRSNIKIGNGACNQGTCQPPTTTIALSETEYAATLTFADVNGETNPTYGIVWGPQGFNPETAGTTVSPITADTYTISGLTQQTNYDVYVYAICGGTPGRKVRHIFTTPFIPNCKTPVDIAASNITYNTADLEWRQPGDVPQTWTIRYATADFNPATATDGYYEKTVAGGTTAAIQLTGLVAGTTYYVYIKATCSTDPLDESPWSSVSNATPAFIFTTPTCFTPTDVTASDVTNSTAVISWDSDATAWTVKYGPQGFDLAAEGVEITSNTPSIELTQLSPNVKYDVYVMSNCTATDVSGWSDVCTFRTSCPGYEFTGAEELMTIGTGTNTNNFLPSYNFYNYSLTEQIYTFDEIGGPGIISSIAFYNNGAEKTRNIDVYLLETDKESFTNAYDWVAVSPEQKVYSGSYTFTVGEWSTFTLPTPFVYTGSGNLLIVVDDNTGSYSSSPHAAYLVSDAPSRALRIYNDGTNYDPENPSSYSGTIMSVRNNIQLNIQPAVCDVSVTCFAPASVNAVVSTESNTFNNVVITWASRSDLRPVVNNFELKYGPASFNPDIQGAGTLVSNLNDEFTYTITEELRVNTEYEVYVRTNCGNGEYSDWTKATFTTYPSCWAPVNLALVGAPTTNSVTLSWANDDNSPILADRWEVVYGEKGFNPDAQNVVPLPSTTNNTAYEVGNLMHSTSYDFYVRAVCSQANKSGWSSKLSVVTECGVWSANELPITEDFEGYNSGLPNCWVHVGNGTGAIQTNTVNGGSKSVKFSGATGNNIVALPPVHASNETYVLSFYTRPEDVSNSSCGTFDVGYLTDATAESFVAVETYAYNDFTAYEQKEVQMTQFPEGARPAFRHAATSSSWYWFLDDVNFKVLEHTNLLADAGETKTICHEYVIPDTTNGGSYHGDLNATYVIRPAEAGKVAHIIGTYDLENGYDYLNVYRGAVNENNLVGRYTGNGPIDYKTGSNLWADSGYVTLVLTTDADNAFPQIGFKLLVECDDPEPAADIDETFVENGSFTWRNGETYTNNIVRTGLTYDATAHPTPDEDKSFTESYTYYNVAGADSVTYNMTLTLHPTYSLTYNATICERDVFAFYGNEYTATNTYTVPLQSQFGADSTGILVLQVNPAPSAEIYYGGHAVTEIANFCDMANLTLLARSDNSAATFVWGDGSTNATNVVNPHESDTYTVVATAPTGCTSLPATVTVTTTPVPALTISGNNEICYGQSTTLTVVDANNLDAAYRWSTGATTTSITVNPTETMTYTVTATTNNASACAVTAEYTVTVNPLPVIATPTTSVSELCLNESVTLTAAAVDGYTYLWNNGATTNVATAVPTATGTYTVTVTDGNGCQQDFTTAAITVHPSYEVDEERSACVGMLPYTWGTMTLNAAGSYDQHFTIAHGCDSLVHLTFEVQDTTVINSTRELCLNTPFTFGTGIYEQSYVATETGVISYVDTTSDECPTRYNLHLTVNMPAATSFEETVCDSYTWNNVEYTTTGAYDQTMTTTKGCDSVVTLNLTVNYQNTGVETVTACDNFVWDLNGVNYTASTNEPTFTLHNQWGCDSVVTLNLTVNTRTYHEEFHCVSDARTYTWLDGHTYRLSVDVTDSIEWITGENADGCNEIALLHLVMNPVLDSLAWTTVEACDEYVINNAVVIDETNCEGVVQPAYLRESGDHEIRTRNTTTGQDQMTRIHLTINQSTYHTTIASECLPYTWTITDVDGNPFEIATITAEMVNGASVYNTSVDLAEAGFVTSTCSSIEVLRLTPKYPTVEVTDEVTICANGSWTADNNVVFSGANYASGIYTWSNTELNAAGCPWVKQVNLTVNPFYQTTADMTFCESEFVYNEATSQYELAVADVVEGHNNAAVVLTIPGDLNEVVYTNSVDAEWKTALGCDSTVTINYTVNPTLYEDVYAENCYEYTWALNRETYRIADGATQTHQYTATMDNGCNYVTTLHLTLNDTARGYENRVACTTYEYDGVTYRSDMTFVEEYEGDTPIMNGCDSVTYISYHVVQAALNHQYVVSNRPYTWKNGQTFSQSVENVYYDVPVGGAQCDSVLALHFTMVDPITFCDNAFPYNTGINDITITTGDIVMDEASFCLDNQYAYSVGRTEGGVKWGIKFGANRPTDYYNVYGAKIYYVNNYPGNYTLNLYAGGDNAPGTLIGTKTVTFSDADETGWKYVQLDEPVVVDGTNLWVTFDAGTVTYPAAVVNYFDEGDQNGAWVSGDGGTTWTSLNENNATLFNSFMIKAVYSANMWRNDDPQGNDTILYYTVNKTYNHTEDVDVCNTYTWDGTTYTESGLYTKNYTSVDGCDSIYNINLTVRNSTTATVNVTECDSYTWTEGDGETYTESGTHVYTTTNLANCDSVVTLNLTINKNNGVEVTVNNGCDSYTWTDGDGVTYTVSGDYSFQFADANGCVGDSVLHLTINPSYETNTTLVVNEGGSYTYLGVMYPAPFDDVIDHIFQSVNGCDSLDHLHLVIPVIDDNEIEEVLVTACGSYTWDGHTYVWIPMSERQSHGMAMYKDATLNRYVYTYPTDTVFDGNGVMTHVYVLHLNLLESTTSTETVNVPLSLGHYDILNVVDNSLVTTVDFSENTNQPRNFTPIEMTVGVGSVSYCDDYRTFTINLIDNYDTTEYFICADATTYEWNNETYTVGEPGHTYFFTQKENEGTMNELVHTRKVNQRAVNAETITETVCDTYTWEAGNGQTYTESVTGVVHNYTDANECAATKTLNLTVKHNTNIEVTKDECDTYTWAAADGGNGNAYTESGDYTYNYTAANDCPSTNTLHLTIRNNTNTTVTKAECETYTWTVEDGGDGRVLTASGTETYEYTATNGCPSINTLNLTINHNTNATVVKDECDTYTWTAEDGGNGQTYTASGVYTYDYNSAVGNCPSTNTLNLTIRTSTSSVETLTQCDSYTWADGIAHTESGDYTYVGTNEAGCDSNMTLHLTINVNTTGVVVTVTACDEYTWDINNRPYTTSGTYTARTTDGNGCATTNTLHLTINESTPVYDSIFYVSDGSYRYPEQGGELLVPRTEPYNFPLAITGFNADNCPADTNLIIYVGTAELEIVNVVNCNSYTWAAPNGNGETYVFIDNDERNAHPNTDNDLPLYKTINGTYVYYNPTNTVHRDGNYDMIYMLALTLTQSFNGFDEVTMNISDRTLNYGEILNAQNELTGYQATFNFDTLAVLQQDFVNTTKEFEVHFPAVRYCDSIITLTINLVNNYQMVDADDICVTETSYTWRGHTISTATNDYDHAHTLYVYDTLANGTIEYRVVNQHPLIYSTERRTACDSYTWDGNGVTYTESTSTATAYFPAGTVINEGTADEYTLVCDSTVTLILTINHNTNTTTTVDDACETFTWLAANGGNGETYTVSGTYTRDYLTAQGCPSTNTLVLTVNNNTNTEYTVDVCDSYTWTAEEGGDGRVLTANGTYTYDYNTAAGCPSTNTLNLTIRNNSNQTYTKTVCDTYTWTEGGDGETYTVSGVYTYDYTADNGCPSTNTLNLTVNQNSGHVDVVMDCDSALWHGVWYYADNNTATYDYVDGNNCPSVDHLNLTIATSTHNSETVVACQSYTWHESTINNPSSVGDMFHNTYEYNYTNEAGCPSVDTLHLTLGGGRTFGTQTVTNCGPYTWVVNDEEVATLPESVETSTSFQNPRTGCDSVVFLYLTVLEAPVFDTAATICDNELPYTWKGQTLTEAGQATVTYPFSATCDSTVRLTLTVNPTKVTNLTEQVCLGNGYNEKGFNIAAADLPAAGEYAFVLNLTTTTGCDSTVNLTITVGETINNIVDAVTACDSYEWTAGDGETYTYTVSGTYSSEAYANASGCTTVDVLTLTINNNSSTGYTETVCDAYMWNGTQYTTSGDYTYDYVDGNGCASTDTLHLTVNNSVVNPIDVTACDSYTWSDGDGETYTTSGVHTYNYTTVDGCNGTDYLVLTITNSTTSNTNVTACDSYTWNGTLYEQSGTYTFSTVNAAGCDSTATLTLTINASNTSIDLLAACDSYTWIDGNVYTASNNTATYTLTNAAGCDSVVTLNLIVNSSVANSISVESCNSYVWENTYYDASGVYEKTFQAANGCDSVVTMTLVINTPVATSFNETACGSYTWNGITYTATNAYTQTLTAANGCDSVVTLNLTVNQPVANAISAAVCDTYAWDGSDYTAPGTFTRTYTAANGCDSVVTLTLTKLPAVQMTLAQTACDSYTWHDQTYSTSGNYTWTGTAANGCDSVVTLALTVNTSVTSTATATACQSYNWNGNTYTTSGNYTWTGTAANGCDSTVTLTLTVNTPVNVAISAAACGSYTWHGVTYTTSGTYTWTGTAANGCDSIVTLTLTINQPTSGTETAEACGSYTWHGQTYTASGFYTYSNLTNAAGCDSSVTLMLTIKQPVYATVNVDACDSYSWNGETYTVSGSYVDTAVAANGCDSITTLVLTVNNSTTGVFAVTACGSYNWNGTVYNNDGTYTQTLSTVNGCDSVVSMTLTINMPIEVFVTEEACSSYEWNGQTYTESGTYSVNGTAANGCDSITTLNLTINQPTYSTNTVTAAESYTWNGQTYNESGTYVWNGTNAAGCDSVATLVLTIDHYYAVTITINDATMGSVQGAGVYQSGATVNVTATANSGYHFVGWVNGTDTVSRVETYSFTVTEDVMLLAVFAQDAPNAIDVTDMSNVTIYSSDTRIFVRGAEGYDVYVYDVNGRVMNSQMKAGEAIEFRMPATGVYLVKVGNAPAKRVLVVR